MFKKALTCTFLLLIAGCASQPPNSEITTYYQAKTPKPYADVLAELKLAIAEHNFRITAHSSVGKIIRERSGAPFLDYDTLQFCNLTHAKTLLQLSPHSVRHMPCTIVAYRLNQQTLIKTRLLPTTTNNNKLNQFSAKMNAVLKQIVDFAVEK